MGWCNEDYDSNIRFKTQDLREHLLLLDRLITIMNEYGSPEGLTQMGEKRDWLQRELGELRLLRSIEDGTTREMITRFAGIYR